MSVIWDTLIDCKTKIIEEFDKRGTEIQEKAWHNLINLTMVG